MHPVPMMRAETACALNAARAAGAILRRRENAEIVHSKGELDIVTGADLAAEDAIRKVLAEGTSLPVVGEERAADERRPGQPYWLVDPLCGTQTFACRIPAFCTNIALVENEEVTAAALFDGATGDLYWAERGRGAFRVVGSESQRLQARETSVLGIEHALPPRSEEWTSAFGRLFAALLYARRWHVRLLGTTLPFTRVASGDYAGLFLLATVSSPVHTAAGCLLAEESGAIVTDTSGKRWDLQSTEFVVGASTALHADLLKLHSQCFSNVGALA